MVSNTRIKLVRLVPEWVCNGLREMFEDADPSKGAVYRPQIVDTELEDVVVHAVIPDRRKRDRLYYCRCCGMAIKKDEPKIVFRYMPEEKKEWVTNGAIHLKRCKWALSHEQYHHQVARLQL